MKLPQLKPISAQQGPLLPLFESRVPAGWPSQADDYVDRALDLNELLIRHPAATFFARAQGSSMRGLGIFDGDILIVDRAAQPVHGDVVVAALDGELTCKVLDRHHGRLLSANDKYPPIQIHEDASLVIEGVVTASIRLHRALPT